MAWAADCPANKFQFTLPCRERRTPGMKSPSQVVFQFTLPCRERRATNRSETARRSFNSRSRVGSDTMPLKSSRLARVFQFTLPCRERRYTTLTALDDRVFQFTLPCRERRPLPRPQPRNQRFQFTLPCRERLTPRSAADFIVRFNSRSRVGSDWLHLAYRADHGCFNSRSRVGSDFRRVRPHLPNVRVSIHAPV